MDARPRVSVYVAVSLDGQMARADGGLDWLDRMQVAGEDYGYAEFYASVDALVVGRRTYDAVLAFPAWPFDGKRVIVLTHRPLDALHGEQRHAGALAPLLRRLATDGVRHVYLDGGLAVRTGLAEGVVDELTLSVVPALLGDGRPLFGPGTPPSDWTLVRSRAYASGLVQSTYRRASG